VAEAGEQGRPGAEREPIVDHARGAPGQSCFDLPGRADHGADPGRRRADHRNALLGRAELRLGEMLLRTPAPEPRVVRRVEDEVGAVATIDHLAGKNDLVAELEADLAP